MAKGILMQTSMAKRLAARSGLWPSLVMAIGMMLAATNVIAAWSLQGEKSLFAMTRDDQKIKLATVIFTPVDGDRLSFKIVWAEGRMKDYFLSMREFKCLDGKVEVLCHVPYPYQSPATVSATDLAWLEHALLFMFKRPNDFGANLWNGIYYQFSTTENGLVGRLQAIDLNRISAPPSNSLLPPYRKMDRDDLPEGSRWIRHLSVE
jgi:hypothetical protein